MLFCKIRYAAIALAMLISTVAVNAEAQTSNPATVDPQAVIERMSAVNGSLQSFQAQLHVKGHMVSFPFFGGRLEGTYLFKRPNSYQVDFEHGSRFADPVKNLITEIANPSSWESLRNVAIDPQSQTFDGHPVICLRLTAKSDSDKLDYALAMVDPTTYELEEMEWHYQGGGSVVVTQTYGSVGQYLMVTSQHLELHMSGIRAVADATYTDYQTNVGADGNTVANNK
jgi:hypothetical protein